VVVVDDGGRKRKIVAAAEDADESDEERKQKEEEVLRVLLSPNCFDDGDDDLLESMMTMQEEIENDERKKTVDPFDELYYESPAEYCYFVVAESDDSDEESLIEVLDDCSLLAVDDNLDRNLRHLQRQWCFLLPRCVSSDAFSKSWQ
jgi:hypothetical protein